MKLLCILFLMLGISTMPGYSEQQQAESLVWDDGARTRCFQHISQTRKGAAARKRHVISAFKGTDCREYIGRARVCHSRSGVWKQHPFMDDGTCPAWFVMTYNWTLKDKDRDTGWGFSTQPSGGDDSPLIMRVSNLASGVAEPCKHREVNFAYNFPKFNFKLKNRRPLKVSDFDDVILKFDARLVRSTKSRCKSLKRNLVKISFVLRWYDRTLQKKPFWQSSIALLIYDAHNWFEKVKAKRRAQGKLNVAFWNKCGVHGVYKTSSCMLSLTAKSQQLPQLTSEFQNYSVSLTRLMEEKRSFLEPRRKAKGFRLEDAEIKSVQIISAVNGADVVFDLKNTRLLGIKK